MKDVHREQSTKCIRFFPMITSYGIPISMFLSATFMVQKAAFLRGSCNKNENYSRDGDSVQQDSRLRNAKMNAFWLWCFFAVSKCFFHFVAKVMASKIFIFLSLSPLLLKALQSQSVTKKYVSIVIVLKSTMTQTVQFILSPFQ